MKNALRDLVPVVANGATGRVATDGSFTFDYTYPATGNAPAQTNTARGTARLIDADNIEVSVQVTSDGAQGSLPATINLSRVGGTGATQTTPVRLELIWLERSRAILQAPFSAVSARVILRRAKPDGSDFVMIVNRPAGSAAVTQTYTSAEPARVGTWLVRADFFSQPNGQGERVGFSGTTARLLQDGSGVRLTSLWPTITTLDITPGQALRVGETADLGLNILDYNGDPVRVTPGSVFYEVLSGADVLAVVGGQLQGLRPGEAVVRVYVDGAQADTTVRVVSSDGGASESEFPSVTGELTVSSPALDDGTYFATHTVRAVSSGEALVLVGSPYIDPVLFVYEQAANGDLIPIGSNDDFNPDKGTESGLRFPVTAGSTYVLAVNTFSPGEIGEYVVVTSRELVFEEGRTRLRTVLPANPGGKARVKDRTRSKHPAGGITQQRAALLRTLARRR